MAASLGPPRTAVAGSLPHAVADGVAILIFVASILVGVWGAAGCRSAPSVVMTLALSHVGFADVAILQLSATDGRLPQATPAASGTGYLMRVRYHRTAIICRSACFYFHLGPSNALWNRDLQLAPNLALQRRKTGI